MACASFVLLHSLTRPYRLDKTNAQENVALWALLAIALLQVRPECVLRSSISTIWLPWGVW